MARSTLAVVRALPAALAIVLAACVLGSCERPSPPPAKVGLRIVTTTSMIADAARNIAGDKAEVIALMGQGVDPHVYKASPGDVRVLESADLILYNGLHLEGRMADTLAQLGTRRRVVAVTVSIPPHLLRSPPEFDKQFDPHVWFDPSLWTFVVEHTRDAMIELDPAGADHYRANADRYAKELGTLAAWTTKQIATIPESQRVLVTAHDAFGYFGQAFGLRVLGVQGISTDSETSIETIRGLVALLAEQKVPAVFIESSVPRKAIESLIEGARARGHSLVIGGELYSDAMGPAGTPEGTYVGMFKHNVRAIVSALGGTVEDAAPAAVKGP
jgi:manganese/zinc/iron transport system substrate-binding protein